jgi:HSP20 family protein
MYRRYRIPSMWQEIAQLQREMNRMYDGYYPSRLHTAPGYPALNIWSSENGLTITAEVPGVTAENIEISVVGETLTLSGTRNPNQVSEETRYHRQERGNGRFNRTVQLPYPVDVKKVEATFKNGVLQMTLPRAEEDKPKKIVVKSR